MRGKWRAQRADGGAHAARGFVGGAAKYVEKTEDQRHRFNAARGFVGGAASTDSPTTCCPESFNAARGFVGGAADLHLTFSGVSGEFQCRTRLCGWCSNTDSQHQRC